ncbi:hypothetical protein D3227_25690 [Mesorhizobium waimense]|uniref:DUF2190 family protein n=1 Tax=Mesorhizobium waimense TaxID=1300307 RepID=A0A3A5KJH5_9HYPH|nr:hypothetical protein [Mesorhizobium waimense]RJT32795.1 hypothetical protein D3227_25690 [Mesorhizobium waimense]
MADLTITAASVVTGGNGAIEHGTAGETIAAGKAVYLAATNKWMLADSNSATALARRATGIALNGASLNQPVTVQKSGNITIGATVVAGTAYYLSDTPGSICPLADVGTGEYVCLIGIASSATVIGIDIQFPNVAL